MPSVTLLCALALVGVARGSGVRDVTSCGTAGAKPDVRAEGGLLMLRSACDVAIMVNNTQASLTAVASAAETAAAGLTELRATLAQMNTQLVRSENSN